MKMQVIKRDGSIEEYSEAKIAKVIIAAGLEPNQVQKITFVISESLKKMNLSKLSSLKIKDKVIEELKKVNQDAANLFFWYEKTKD